MNQKEIDSVNDQYEDIVFAKIDRGEFSQLRLSFKEFMKDDGSIGKFVHFREYFLTDDGTFIHTKKGCTFPISEWENFLEGVNKLNNFIEDLKLFEVEPSQITW